MLTWLRRRFHRRRIPPRVELAADGFAIVDRDGSRHPVRWSSITKLAAYKRDLLTTDEIMLAIEVAEAPGMVQEVSEEWDNFAALFSPMEQHLGVSPAWYREIMVPAFETSFRVLYERPRLSAVDGLGEPAG